MVVRGWGLSPAQAGWARLVRRSPRWRVGLPSRRPLKRAGDHPSCAWMVNSAARVVLSPVPKCEAAPIFLGEFASRRPRATRQGTSRLSPVSLSPVSLGPGPPANRPALLGGLGSEFGMNCGHDLNYELVALKPRHEFKFLRSVAGAVGLSGPAPAFIFWLNCCQVLIWARGRDSPWPVAVPE